MKTTIRHPLRLALGLCLGLAPAAFPAGVYYVDEAARGPYEDGLSWACAYRTLAHALAARTGEFRVAAGVYTASDADGIELGANVLFGGYPNGGGDRDLIANLSILNGGGAARLFKKTTPGRATLDGFTLQNGKHGQGGGALYASTGSLAIANCLFTGNSAPFAGAVWCVGGEPNTFSNCTFTLNYADTAGEGRNNGGACAFTGCSTNRFEDCVFRANTARDHGGALAGGGLLQLVRCGFTNNGAGQSGGAIYAAVASMTDCSFAGSYDDESGEASGSVGRENRTWSGICGEGNVDVVLDLGRGGAGRFRLTGGQVETPSLAIGSRRDAGGAGWFSQSGGTVRVVGQLDIGGAATGVYEVVGSAGTIAVGGTLSVDPKGTLALRPEGNALTPFSAGGLVTLAAGARLTVEFLGEPRIGDVITVIENASGEAVRGTFTDVQSGAVLKEGGEFLARSGKGDVRLRISYGAVKAANGGDKNVTLKVVSVPAAPAMDSALGAVGITGTSAWLRASLVSTGMSATAVWYAWGPSDGATGVWANTRMLGANTAAPPVVFSNRVTGLITNGLYYYAFAASNGNATVWSATQRFKTLSRPAVVFGSAAARTARNKAVLNGVLADGSQAAVTAFWGPSDGGTTPSAWPCSNGLGLREEGPFAARAEGLTPGAGYTCRFQARNAYGEVWTEAKTFTAQDVPGPGGTWSGMGGADNRWTTDANWEGGAMPGKPATSAIAFNDTDAGRANRMDEDWELANGLTVANTNGGHTMDLGGHTLRMNGGELRVGYGVSGSAATFTNGTLKLGDASAASVNLGYGGSSATLTINSDLSMNLGTVTIGSANHTTAGSGTLDLRNAALSQNTVFACSSLIVGLYGAASTGSSGNLYLNDGGGKITALQVQTLSFCNGTLTLNAGAGVTIGNSGNRGSLVVGRSQVGATATLAPTGAFSAWLTTLAVGEANWTGPVSGTLDLRGATLQALNVSDLVTIGSSCFSHIPGVGQVYLPAGNAYFGGLSMGVNTDPGSSNLLRIAGTALTIGNNNTNRFDLETETGRIELDFSQAATELIVYGNYRSSGPATNIPAYVADGRIQYLPASATASNRVEWSYDGTNTHVRLRR